jgi:glycosyltransferase involved in cell wall biosynthesis
MDSSPKKKILFLLNQLRAGTGPFQRAIRLDDEIYDITILSCYDTTENVTSIARLLRPDFGNRKIVGLGVSSKFKLAFSLTGYILRHKPEIIQTSHTFSTVVAVLVRRIFRQGIVVNFEGTLFTSMSPLKRYLLKLVFSFADGTICVSNAVEETNRFSSRLFKQYSVRRVIYNGVDHDEIDNSPATEFKGSEELNDNAFVFGFIGDLKSVKDIPTLIKGFALVANEIPNTQLLLVGGGVLKDMLFSLVNELGLLDRVVFTDHIHRHEVYSALRRMDVFVLASKIEGLSEAVAQAMASSLPVIASDINPNSELIVHHKNGLLFPVGDVEKLSEALMEMYVNNAQRYSFAKANKFKSMEILDINNVVKSYEDFYAQLVV